MKINEIMHNALRENIVSKIHSYRKKKDHENRKQNFIEKQKLTFLTPRAKAL